MHAVWAAVESALGKCNGRIQEDEHLVSAVTMSRFSVDTSHNPVRLVLTSDLQMRAKEVKSSA